MATMAFPGFPHQHDNYVLDGGYSQGYDGDHGGGAYSMSQQRQIQRENEHKQDLVNDRAHKPPRYVYRTLEDLTATNPSVRDGLDADKELKWRRQYCKLILEAGIALRMHPWGVAVGITLCHRFFAVKSMKRNDRFLVATACIFLAAKMQENPKPLKNVIQEAERIKTKSNVEAMKALDDPAHFERIKEEVLQAERAVLYTLGFDLDIEAPHKPLIDWLTRERLMEVPHDSPYKPLVQNSLNIVNDSLRTTLCLQFPPAKIAWAALWIADLLNYDNNVHYSKLPTGAAFFEKFDITPEELTTICDQILSEYEQAKLGKVGPPSEELMQSARAQLEGKTAAASRIGPGGGRPAPARGVPGTVGGVKLEEEEGEVQD